MRYLEKKWPFLSDWLGGKKSQSTTSSVLFTCSFIATLCLFPVLLSFWNKQISGLVSCHCTLFFFNSISYCWLQATTLLFPVYISTHRPCTAAINMIAKKKRLQSANSFVILNLCYLSKGEHLVWSIMKNNGNLSQVGGGVAEQSLLSAAGWIRERQRSAQVPCLVLHLVCWRVKLCTGECCRSPHLVMMCPWSGQPRLYVLLEQFIRVFLTIAFSFEDESLMLEEQPLRES